MLTAAQRREFARLLEKTEDAGTMPLSADELRLLHNEIGGAYYAGQPAPLEPAEVLTRKARVEVLRRRVERREQLFRDDDPMPDHDAMLAIDLIVRDPGNGRGQVDGLAVAGQEEPDDDEWEDNLGDDPWDTRVGPSASAVMKRQLARYGVHIGPTFDDPNDFRPDTET